MDFSLKQNGTDCYRRLTILRSREEYTADAVVPDTQEDIARIIGSSGCVKVRSKDAAAGVVTLTGEVSAAVLYVPESGAGAVALNVAVPFTLEQRYSGADEALPVSSMRLVSLEARMLNPRKVLVKAELCAVTELYCPSRLVWYGEPEDGEKSGLRVKTTNTAVSLPMLVTEKTFIVSDDLALPAGKPAPERILSVSAELRVTDTQDIGGKLIVKGAVRTCVYYLPQNGGQPEFAAVETPFSQLMEASGGTQFEITPMLTDVYLELLTIGTGERTLSLEAHGVLQAVCRETQEITCISDAYCIGCELRAEYENMSFDGQTSCALVRAAPRGQFELQRPCTGVVGASAVLSPAEAGGGKVAALLTASVVYLSDDGELYGESFKMTAEGDGDGEDPWASVSDVTAIPTGMSIEIRAQVDFGFRLTQSTTVKAVVSMSTDDESTPARRPSVTVIRAGTEDLWELAKKYSADMDDIAFCNGLDGQQTLTGRILLIP